MFSRSENCLVYEDDDDDDDDNNNNNNNNVSVNAALNFQVP
jgi:hypothetical protein